MNHEETIFEQALGIGKADAREAFLRGACAGDEAMFERLQGLLRVHDRAGKFMEHERPAPIGVPSSGGSATRPAEAGTPNLLSEKPGDRIGRYKLLQQIGEGGCGVVYMAEQEEPVRRRVALKIIKLGMDTKQVIARFEAERQALALMDHPNIAKVFDAGATGPPLPSDGRGVRGEGSLDTRHSTLVTYSGRPYFVMELVRGVKITDYCDEKKLTTQERLELFIQVCQAVQHAHQKGIIHRDLKPSNVLVAVNDGRTAVKVIDFGIAKATNGERLTDKTVFTAFEQFIGTPAYMSPEQAEITNVDIDTRSDIYSLGVLLYELLTGQTPFDAKELLKAGLDEMRRTLREKEPPRPSTRLSTLGADELTTTAHRRGLEGLKLVNVLRGDLDWIVMKCLEKDRARRYETANGLALDIQRHLHDEPVVACPPSQLYRFQKMVHRNKLAFGVAAAISVVLVAGVVASTWEAIRARRAEGAQIRLRQQAETAQANEAGERGKAEHAAEMEAEQRARAQTLAEQNRVNLYAARIKVAEQTLKDGDVSHAMEFLDSLRPREGEQDLRSFDWYYLWQRCHSERLTLSGNQGRVLCVSISGDGRLLAFAGDEGVIRLCDRATGAEHARLTGHKGRVGSVVFCPDGKRIASAGADATVRIWDLATAKELHTLQIGTNSISALAFSPDGALLAAAEGEISTGQGNPATMYFPHSSAGGIRIWNTSNFQVERSLQGHPDGILSLAFSPDGRKLACSGREVSSLRLYELGENRQLAVQTNFPGFVSSLAYTPDGRELVACSWFPWHSSGEIAVLDAVTLEQKRVLAPDAGKILCMALSQDGKQLASAGADQAARLWDYESGNELATFYGHNAAISSLAFAPDGRELATAGWDGTVRVWNLETASARHRIETTSSFSVSFSPDGKLLACSGVGVEVREVNSGQLARSLVEYTNSNDVSVTFSQDGSLLAASGYDRAVHFWDTHDWRHWEGENSRWKVEFTPYDPDDRLALAPDGRTLAEGCFTNTVRLWNTSDGRLNRVITNRSRVDAVAYAPGGEALLLGGAGLAFWATASNAFTTSLGLYCPLFRVSRDGRLLASVASSNHIIVRDMPTLRFRMTLVGHRENIYCLAFSHDGRLLASASWDGTVKIWHLASGQELLSIPSMGGVVWSVAFAPDDRTLAFGSGAGKKGLGAVTLLRAASDADVLRNWNAKPSRPSPFNQLQATIPRRAENCPADLVDLSAFFYDAHASNPGRQIPSNNELAELTPGIHTLGGVPFDVRGIVRLACSDPSDQEYPISLQGIHVGRECQAVRFLQATAWGAAPGKVIGEYVIHFADGRQEKVPLVYGQNLCNGLCGPEDPVVLGPQTRAAWESSSRESPGMVPVAPKVTVTR